MQPTRSSFAACAPATATKRSRPKPSADAFALDVCNNDASAAHCPSRLCRCACNPFAVFAWNETGHMTVALIAYRRLSDEQKKQIGEILKSHPHYQLFLIEGKPADVDEGEWAFLKAASWPDFVRPYGNKPETITKYHHGPWHYVDVPFVVPKDKDAIDASQLKPNDPSLLTALPDCMTKLGRTDTHEPRTRRSASAGCCTSWATCISRCTARRFIPTTTNSATWGKCFGDPHPRHADAASRLLGRPARHRQHVRRHRPDSP